MCPPGDQGQGAGARWRSSPRPSLCPHSALGAYPACGQPSGRGLDFEEFMASCYLEYPLEAGVMNRPSSDLAQEANLTAQVVVEVGQAAIVTVVHPVMKI